MAQDASSRTPEGEAVLAEGQLALVRQQEVFAGLPQAKVAELFPACVIKEYRDEVILCHCPDHTHDAFVVLEGTVALTHVHGQEEYTLELTGFGGVFNVGPLVGAPQDHGAARALGPVRLLAMDTQYLQRVFEADRDTGYHVLRNLARLLIGHYERQLDRALG